MRILFIISIAAILCMGAGGKKERFMKEYGCRYWEEMTNSPNQKIAPVIVAQSIHESGWGTAKWVKRRNQLTATYDLPEVYMERYLASGKKAIEKLRIFKSFDEYFDYKKGYYKRKGYSLHNMNTFVEELGSKGYAKDPKYVEKIEPLIPQVTKLYYKYCINK